MESLIDSKISCQVNQDVTNESISAPSPVPVCQSPSQGRQDPSLCSSRRGFGYPESEPEEPVQQESAIPSFLESLRNAGIDIPQGISLLDSSDRVRFREPMVSQGRVWHVGSANARLAPGARVSSALLPEGVDPAWLDVGVNEDASSSSAALAGRSVSVEPSPHSVPADPAVRSALVEPTARSVSFAESVFHSVDDSAASVSSEKPPPQEGLRSILWLLYQLCPSAASESSTSSDQKTCEIESL